MVLYANQYGFNEELFLDAGAAERAGFAGRLVPGSLVMTLAEGLVISGGSITGTGMANVGNTTVFGRIPLAAAQAATTGVYTDTVLVTVIF